MGTLWGYKAMYETKRTLGLHGISMVSGAIGQNSILVLPTYIFIYPELGCDYLYTYNDTYIHEENTRTPVNSYTHTYTR